MLVGFAVPDIPKSLVREQLLHKSVKDELQTKWQEDKMGQQKAAATTSTNRYVSNLKKANSNRTIGSNKEEAATSTIGRTNSTGALHTVQENGGFENDNEEGSDTEGESHL